ncbi:MAG: methionyl-tRNA formyltransferase [Candidatus Eremiobacteraeota bacterium]|nr:methionyl-tRNA formyltransferase [Candidatus Eremiobacteraeota bacterium]
MKVAALELGVPVFEPLRLGPFAGELRALAPELFVVASYGKILPSAILSIPRLGALNVHPSVLPLYRGATPLQAQIRDLRATTGVTIIVMDAGMDTGDIVLAQSSPLGARETYGELEARLSLDGARLLEEAVALAQGGALPRRPQAGLASEREIEATLTRPLRAEDFSIDWRVPAPRVDALVRSLAPRPLARGTLDGVTCKIVATRPLESVGPPRPPGTVWRDRGLFVACGEGAVEIERLIPPNRPAMAGSAF